MRLEKLGTRKIRARRFKTSQCVGNLAGMGAWVLTRGCSDVAAHARVPDISFFDKSHQKKWRNSHNYHVIIFYKIYVDNLIENIFRAVSFFTFRTIEKLFFVLSYFRFYEMNFFHWNLMAWEAFIPKYSSIFRVTRKIFSLGSSRIIARLKFFCALLEK